MSETLACVADFEFERDRHVTQNDVITGLKRAGIYGKYRVYMGTEQSSHALFADMLDPELTECANDILDAFPDGQGRSWEDRILTTDVATQALQRRTQEGSSDLGSFIREQIPTQLHKLRVNGYGEAVTTLMTLDLGRHVAVDICGNGEVWDDGYNVDYNLEVTALFRWLR